MWICGLDLWITEVGIIAAAPPLPPPPVDDEGLFTASYTGFEKSLESVFVGGWACDEDEGSLVVGTIMTPAS